MYFIPCLFIFFVPVFNLLCSLISCMYIFFGRCSFYTLNPSPWWFCSKCHLTVCNLSFHFHMSFKHFLFFNFSVWKTLRLIKKMLQKQNKEVSYTIHPDPPNVNTLQYQNQEILFKFHQLSTDVLFLDQKPIQDSMLPLVVTSP